MSLWFFLLFLYLFFAVQPNNKLHTNASSSARDQWQFAMPFCCPFMTRPPFLPLSFCLPFSIVAFLYFIWLWANSLWSCLVVIDLSFNISCSRICWLFLGSACPNIKALADVQIVHSLVGPSPPPFLPPLTLSFRGTPIIEFPLLFPLTNSAKLTPKLAKFVRFFFLSLCSSLDKVAFIIQLDMGSYKIWKILRACVCLYMCVCVNSFECVAWSVLLNFCWIKLQEMHERYQMWH